MGVRGRTEVRNLNRQWWAYCFSSSRLLSAGCRGGGVHLHGGYRSRREFAEGPQVIGCVGEGGTCVQPVAGTIQEAVADGQALHSRVHLVLRGL